MTLVGWVETAPRSVLVAVVALALFVAIAPPIYSAAAVGAAAVVLVTIARPVVGLAFLAFAVPFGSVVDSRLGALPFGVVDGLAILAVASWLVGALVRREPVALGALFWPLFALVAAGVLSMSFAESPGVAAKELLRWIELLLVYLAATNLVRDHRNLRIIVGAILVAASAESLLGAVQFFTRIGPPSFAVGRFLRAYGTFGQPNPFAGYLGMVLPLALALVVVWRGARRDWLWRGSLGALAIVGSALLMSMSRGAWMGLAAALLVGAAIVNRRAAIAALAVTGLGTLALSLESLQLLPAFIAQRIASVSGYFRIFDARGVQPSPDTWAIVERMAHWQAGWEMLLDNPLVGVGPGHYPLAYAAYAILPYWKDPLGHAHNIYLHIGAELGLVGLLAYLACLASWMLLGVRRSAAVDPSERAGLARALSVGVLGCLVAAAVHNIFDNLYVHGMNVHVALLVGTLAGLPARGQGVDNFARQVPQNGVSLPRHAGDARVQ